MSIEQLKKQARQQEQVEAWDQALALYRRALEATEDEGEPEIALYNRVADLEVRVGQVDDAVANYEQAIELYLEADLPNNAMAICRKVLRNMPERAETFLRMGQIRARQGFGVEARQHLLTYAELMQGRGDDDAATRALEELVEHFPTDVESRIFLGERLVGLGDPERGVVHLLAGWHALEDPEGEEAKGLAERIRALDPEADFETPPETRAREGKGGRRGGGPGNGGGLTSLFGDGGGPMEAFLDGSAGSSGGVGTAGTPTLDPGDLEDEADDEELPAMELADIEFTSMEEGLDPDEAGDAEGPGPEEGFETFSGLEGGAVVEADPVPEPDGFPGPDLVGEDGGEAEDDGGFEFGDIRLSGDDPEPGEAFDEDEGEDGALALPSLGEEVPTPEEEARARVARAQEEGDRPGLLAALRTLAGVLESEGKGEEADLTHEQVLQLDPRDPVALGALGRSGAPDPGSASWEGSDLSEVPELPGLDQVSGEPEPREPSGGGDDFVDLGALILDDREPPSTRWVVEDHRSGDEAADFARMLSRFKAKVAEHINRDDARSSYDLGTAYREMGLMDEAIAMFQQALRAHPDHLASLEMLGQCFLDREEPQVAIRVLDRAVRRGAPVEDDLLGIYYFLGLAHERAGNRDEALEFYEKVFALDINFKDVTDRLRVLR